jgi:guanyl-specific ribonuclease Sa
LQNISSGFAIVRENPRRKSYTKKADMGTNGGDRRVVCAWAGDKRSKTQLIYLTKKTYTKVCSLLASGMINQP